jgi:hypothetical protein
MALGALDTIGRGALERWYHRVVAGLEVHQRVMVVAEEGDRLVGMAQLVSAVQQTPITEPKCSGWVWGVMFAGGGSDAG